MRSDNIRAKSWCMVCFLCDSPTYRYEDCTYNNEGSLTISSLDHFGVDLLVRSEGWLLVEEAMCSPRSKNASLIFVSMMVAMLLRNGVFTFPMQAWELEPGGPSGWLDGSQKSRPYWLHTVKAVPSTDHHLKNRTKNCCYDRHVGYHPTKCCCGMLVRRRRVYGSCLTSLSFSFDHSQRESGRT